MDQPGIGSTQLPFLEGNWSILAPTLKATPNFYLPPQFRNVVILHIVKNSVSNLRPPLILAIQGPMGEGKSEQTREVCSQLGINVVSLSGSTISGVHEKEPVIIVREAYKEAAFRNKNGRAILLIDDLDTSVVSTHEDRRYTVNSQLVSGTLMNLADDPLHVGDVNTIRTPIIVTGNDFTHLYEPLTRHGRVWFFDWKPDVESKIEIVKHLFVGHVSTAELEEIDNLVSEFQDEPVAFFHQLRNDLYDELILETIEREGRIDFPHITNLIQSNSKGTTIRELIRLGTLKRQNKPRSYIAKSLS
ncbi:MAG: AAA family ATPase [Anaerolineae bacterium]|nr:AAA family ATPase [Anaerolineae bacterium]